jgi:hypothetical protein
MMRCSKSAPASPPLPKRATSRAELQPRAQEERECLAAWMGDADEKIRELRARVVGGREAGDAAE